MTADRIQATRRALPDELEALLVTNGPNARYLTGFTGTNAQVLVADPPVFFTDGRYDEQAATQVPDMDRQIYSASLPFTDLLAKALDERGLSRVGIEGGHLSMVEGERYAGKLTAVELVSTADVVEGVRAQKDAGEIASIDRAQRITEAAVVDVLRGWTGGTERELALALEWAIRTAGAEGVSFDVIVATGAHSALPHAMPRDEAADLELLLIDIGAVAGGYCSDMTRTFLGPRAPDPMPAVHEAVVRSLDAACAAVRPGARCADVDAAARSVLDSAGYGEAFVHSTGHGVGLEIHEGPALTPTSDEVLDEGMVVTIEPGVYLPGIGGVRVEDLLVVTADGARNLTGLDRGPAPLTP